MANVADIVGIAESLEKSPIAIVHDRCVAVRNRNASCRRCVDACAFDAISVATNDIVLSASACMSCGACTLACPTEALVVLAPTDVELLRAAAEAAAKSDGHVLIACARRAARHEADPALFAEVPCLARIGERMIATLVAYGATDVTLVDGACSSCKYRACTSAIDEAVRCANELLSHTSSTVRAARESAFPAWALVEDAHGLYGSDRRGFFTETASAARESVMTAAQAAIRQELGAKEAVPSIGRRLRVGEGGALPHIEVPEHMALLDALDEIGWNAAGLVETRLFGKISIDVGKCNACGMCAVFCPTGALRRDEADSASDPVRFLEFRTCDCVQCGLCADVCWKSAVSLEECVGAEELFDLEPHIFNLASNRKKPLFGAGF